MGITMNDSDRYLWSVDNITPTVGAMVFVDKKPYSGYIVRLVKYKENIEENIGFRYILTNKEVYPFKINFGNTYYFSKDITKVIPVTFSSSEYSIRHLIEPPEIASEVDESLKNRIRAHIDKNIINSVVDAKCLSEEKGQRIWTRIYIHYVGQGDTSILELPNDQIWMIDARLWNKNIRNQFDKWMLKKFNKKKINRLIITHFHYDHIHSVPYIIENYKPDQVVVSNSLEHSTSCVDRLFQYAGNSLYILPDEEITQFGSLQIQLHRTDKYFSLGTIINPNYHEISVILKSENGFALLAGDIPGEICDKLISNSFCHGMNNRKMIYKVSHHGSSTGYNVNFFSNIYPTTSVISCGHGNRYGHPDKFLLSQLRSPTITWQWKRECTQYDI
jgi:competence protein ComEC